MKLDFPGQHHKVTNFFFLGSWPITTFSSCPPRLISLDLVRVYSEYLPAPNIITKKQTDVVPSPLSSCPDWGE